MNQESNFFDNLNGVFNPTDALRLAKEKEEASNRLDYLIHNVFEQSDEGKELLAIWRESLELKPVAEQGMDLLSVGINEGMKRFIRCIILTIRRVENV